MIEAILILEFFTFLIGIAISVYVFSRNPKGLLNIAFTLAALGMAGWNLAIFLLLTGIGPADIIGRISFSSAAILTTGFTWFVYLFPKKIKGYKWFAVTTTIVGLFFILSPFWPTWLSNVQIIDTYIIADFHPVLYPLWALFYTGNFIYTFFVLIARIIKAKGIERMHLGQITLGFATFFIPQQITNLLLPLLANDFRWNSLGPVFTLFLLFFLANGILRFRLLDIRWIIGRSALFILLIGAIMWVVSSTALLVANLVNPNYAMILAALVIVVFFRPISKFLEFLFQKILHNGRYDPQIASKEIFELTRNSGDLVELLPKLNQMFAGYFSAVQCGYIVFKPNTNKILKSELIGFRKTILKHVPSLKKVAEDHEYAIVERGELMWELEFKQEQHQNEHLEEHIDALTKAKVDVLVPFTVDERLVGFMIFGKRRYEKMLRSRDIKFIELMRNAISPALENAAKYAEIKDLYAELSELDKIKSEFITVVSHSFRTPLSAIRWNVEEVLDDYAKRLDKAAKNALNDAHTKTIFLIKTLEHLLETIAFESPDMMLQKSMFMTKPTLKSLMSTVSEIMKKKNVNFSSKVSNLPILADKKLLTQVCESLLLNAAQYTHAHDTVTFHLSPEDGHIKIEVKDTGIGIPKKDIDRIFEKFYRAKNARLVYTDGQGMGLYLIKRIIDMHQGSIKVDSTLEEGAKFTLLIPVGLNGKKKS